MASKKSGAKKTAATKAATPRASKTERAHTPAKPTTKAPREAPMQTITPAVGPNVHGLNHQAQLAHASDEDRPRLARKLEQANQTETARSALDAAHETARRAAEPNATPET